ncbi:MAG: hypothetical protein Q4G02_00720 [bacterium]|nr:hypothetical protein [bacterium]
MQIDHQFWRQSIFSWANELKKNSPSLASLILCADIITEDDQQLTLMVGSNFNKEILVRANQQLLLAASKVGLLPKQLNFLAASECEKKLPPREAVIQEVWENLV